MKLTSEQLRAKIMQAKDYFKAMMGKHITPHNVYRHYKGGVYQVLHIGFHTETEELEVIYKRIGGPNYDEHAEKDIVFVRPLSVWLEPLPKEVLTNQQKLQRQLKRFVPVVPDRTWTEIREWPSGNPQEESNYG